jgi:CRISPR-associated protein Cmr1
MSFSREWTLTAQTSIWTGDAYGKTERLITTGLLGSIRWWYEVFVRGLGGNACDPSDTRTRCEGEKHCVVCELFGCTGWARKFRFDVLNTTGKAQTQQIGKGTQFQLRFTPLRPVVEEEWVLLDLTLRLIADYGAIGGKTVFKPSNEEGRETKAHHRDYGLITLIQRPPGIGRRRQALEDYIKKTCWQNPHDGSFAWASLSNFWCVNGEYLARQDQTKSTFNKVIGRPEPERQSSRNDSWLAGSQGESKKVFSFKCPERTFGFVGSDSVTYDTIRQRLEQVWGKESVSNGKFMTGQGVLDKLLTPKETM